MDEIIIRSLHGRATAEEERRLAGWRKASSSNEAHYREMKRLWGLIRDAEPAVTTSAPFVDEILGRARTDRTIRGPAPRRRMPDASWFSWAAAAAAGLALAFGIAQLRSAGETPAPVSQVAELSTGVGEMATLQLPDASVVRLAPESRLRFTGMPGVRDVWLDGRAFFAVAKQDGVPFRVRTHAGEALVLGTRFEIRAEEDDLRLLVVEGRVALTSGEVRVEVEAGELSHAAPGTEPTVVDVVAVQPMLEWMGAFLVFQSTPLDRFAREFEQHYGIPVRVTEEVLAQRTVTGWFTDQHAAEVLRIVCHAVDAHCSIRDGVATIEP